MNPTVVVLAEVLGKPHAFLATELAAAEARARELGFGAAAAASQCAPAEERWLDSRQLAVLTGVGDTSLEALARQGRIPSLRAGKLLRFKLSEVEEALRARQDL